MNIGFTGTRKGMTAEQKQTFEMFIDYQDNTIHKFHHGDCIGADAEAHNIVLKSPQIKIIIHPPSIPINRAFCTGATAICTERSYRERNQNIVNSCTILIATPETPEEQLRSGTWSTVRFARSNKKWIMIIYPNGEVKEENNMFTN